MDGKGKGKTWFGGVDEWLQKLELERKEEGIIKYRKSEWKKKVKEQLNEWIKKEMEEQKSKMKKLRFTNTTGRQNYLDVCKMDQVKKIMKVRLNMTELKSNFKGKYNNTICPACEEEDETTEHVIKCKEYQRMTQHTLLEGDEDGFNLAEKMENVTWLIKAGEGLEKIEETRKWLLGMKN